MKKILGTAEDYRRLYGPDAVVEPRLTTAPATPAAADASPVAKKAVPPAKKKATPKTKKAA